MTSAIPKALPQAGAEELPPRRATQQEQNGVRYVYPLCAICQREVVAFAWSDHLTPMGKFRTFFAHCHGETETASVPMIELQAMRGFRIEYAFQPLGRPVSDSSPVPSLSYSTPKELLP